MKFRYLWLLLILFSLFACEKDPAAPDELLNPPSLLTIEQLGFESIKLTWQDNSTNEIGFQIDRKIGAGEWEENYRILSENITTFTDLNLLTIATYSYRIRAISLNEESEYLEANIAFAYNDLVSIVYLGEDTVLYSEETANLQFSLTDINYDLVERDYEVWFQLIEAPSDTNINDTLNGTMDSLMVESVDGVVSINLNAGNEGGVVIIKAFSFNSQNEEVSLQTMAIVVIYPEIAEIEILTADQIAFPTNDSVTIRANLNDESGTLGLDEYEVYVEFLGRPEGTNLNHEVYEMGEVLTLNSLEGQVVLSLNSGDVSGYVGIRLYTYNSSGEEISVEKTDIIILPATPAYCGLYPGGNNDGEDMGGGIWRIPLNAYLEDSAGNPITAGTTVFFSLPNNPVSAIIETEAVYVGNSDEPDPGYAYNYLNYDGANTTESIIVRIEVGDFNQEFEVTLPLQFGFLDVVAAPFYFNWTEDDNPEYKDIELRIQLKDGQNNPINGQILSFLMEIGTPLEPSPPDTGDPSTGITGIGTLPPYAGQSGILYKYIRFYKDELPPPNPNPIPIQALFEIYVNNTDIETQVMVTLTRLVD